MVLAAPRVARGQSLDAFLARVTASAEVREADAVVAQRAAERTQALGALIPSLSARAGYTRNQVEVAVTLPGGTRAVITPQDQLDASLTLDVPLLDLGAWSRMGASRAALSAAESRRAGSVDEVRRDVTRAWFTWVGASALRDASARAVEAARRSVERAQRRVEAGRGLSLDAQRAEADLARAEQDLADAALTADTAARTLRSLTGLDAAAPPPLPEDPLRDEPPLPVWERRVGAAPLVRAAESDARASDATRAAAWMRLVPSLNASATQRWTNAAGFGPEAVWSAGLSLSWRLDLATVGAAQAAAAAELAAHTRAERARRDARDAVFQAWSQVRAGILRARAARRRAEAADAAAESARRRLDEGAGTALDLLLAERDAAAAQAARVQSDADLGYARALLRITAGGELRDGGAP
ncbi:MAG: TolC family protein [Polyangiales bacterium]